MQVALSVLTLFLMAAAIAAHAIGAAGIMKRTAIYMISHGHSLLRAGQDYELREKQRLADVARLTAEHIL